MILIRVFQLTCNQSQYKFNTTCLQCPQPQKQSHISEQYCECSGESYFNWVTGMCHTCGPFSISNKTHCVCNVQTQQWHIESNSCKYNCQNNFYYNSITNICTECPNNTAFSRFTMLCRCKSNQIFNQTINECVQCPQNSTVNDFNQCQCVKHDFEIVNNQCVIVCNKQQVIFNETCQQCPFQNQQDIYTCSCNNQNQYYDNVSNSCTTCPDNMSVINNMCQCVNTQEYFDTKTQKCIKNCSDNELLINNQCIVCPNDASCSTQQIKCSKIFYYYDQTTNQCIYDNGYLISTLVFVVSFIVFFLPQIVFACIDQICFLNDKVLKKQKNHKNKKQRKVQKKKKVKNTDKQSWFKECCKQCVQAQKDRNDLCKLCCQDKHQSISDRMSQCSRSCRDSCSGQQNRCKECTKKCNSRVKESCNKDSCDYFFLERLCCGCKACPCCLDCCL